MDKRVKGIDIFLPWLESAGLVLYCCLMVHFNMHFQPSLPVALLFFLPLAGFELYLSIRYEKGRLLSARGIIFLFPRILFLFLFFYLWSVLPLQVMHKPYSMIKVSWLISNASVWIPAIKHVLSARPKIVLVMFVILFFSYYIFFIRMKKARFFISVFLPWLLIFIFFVIFYADLFGGVSRDRVELQTDVKVFFAYPSSDFIEGKGSSWLSISKFPRSLQVDEERKKLYLSFGLSFEGPPTFPVLLEIDMETKNYRAILMQARQHGRKVIRHVRYFGCPPGSEKIYMAPLGEHFTIYGISKRDFKIIEKRDINHRSEIKYFEVYDIFYNNRTEIVYLANALNPLLIKYHLKSEEVEIIDLVKEGIAGVGSVPYKISFSSALNRIYVLIQTARKGCLIVEFETSPFKPSRIIEMPDAAIYMEIDEENKRLLVTSALGRELWEIDLEKFEIIKKIDIPVIFVRGILIDNPNNLLYCLDYLGGRLFLVDRDSGKVYRRYWVGNKPSGLVKFGERIFVSSTLGIIEIKPTLKPWQP